MDINHRERRKNFKRYIHSFVTVLLTVPIGRQTYLNKKGNKVKRTDCKRRHGESFFNGTQTLF